MKRLIFALSAVALFLSSCSKTLQTSVQKSDTKWVLTRWAKHVLPTKAVATLNITNGNKIGGKSFCNTYGGNVTINGNALKIGHIMATKMYCNDVGEAENKFLFDLQHVNAGTISGGRLRLMKEGEVIMVFSKAE